MLQKLLKLIHTGNIQTLQDLAENLNTTPGLILLMINQLVQAGYLQPLSACGADNSSASCASCSSHSSCLLGHTRQAWVLTDRGENLVQSSYCT
jgi:hypothetical protein